MCRALHVLTSGRREQGCECWRQCERQTQAHRPQLLLCHGVKLFHNNHDCRKRLSPVQFCLLGRQRTVRAKRMNTAHPGIGQTILKIM